MTGEIDGERQWRPSRTGWLRAVTTAAEILLLALLLMVDLELGIRFMVPEPRIETISGALATMLVAVIAAALVLARRVVRPRVLVGAVFSVSLLASALSVATGLVSLSLTEAAAFVVATMVGVRGEPALRGAVASASARTSTAVSGTTSAAPPCSCVQRPTRPPSCSPCSSGAAR